MSLPGIRALLLVLLAGLLLFGCGKEQKAQPQAPIVEVVEVIQKDVPVYAEWVGTLDGAVNATIRAQVQGYLIKQNYKEGDFVKKDQVLFEIDPRPYQAAIEEAKGQLAQAEARWQTAKANLVRIRPLAEQSAVSKKDLDDAIGAEESTHASVMSAKAALDKAQLNLDWTKVTSLIDGIAGIAKAQIGNLVGPGSIEELTTVSTINPIKCYVSLSEQEYMRAMERRSKQAGKVRLELILSDGTTYPHKGEFAFADRQVDVRTGTIRVATTFPKSAESPPARDVQPGPRRDGNQEGRTGYPSAGCERGPGEVPGGSGEPREQGGDQTGQGRAVVRPALGHRRRSSGRGEGGRRRDPEGPGRHGREPEAI